jgi:acetoin utilization protein AcuB
MEQTINRIYSNHLVTTDLNADLSSAEEKMNNYNIRHLPVVDADNILVGLISKSDFIALKLIDSRMKPFKVKDVMSSPVKAVGKTASVQDVARLFVNKKISSLIVVDNQEAVGIVTAEDLIKLLAEKPELVDESEQLDLAALAEAGWISNTIAQ